MTDQPSREGDSWTIYICPCGAVIRGSKFGRHSGCGRERKLEVVPASDLQAVEVERDKLREQVGWPE